MAVSVHWTFTYASQPSKMIQDGDQLQTLTKELDLPQSFSTSEILDSLASDFSGVIWIKLERHSSEFTDKVTFSHQVAVPSSEQGFLQCLDIDEGGKVKEANYESYIMNWLENDDSDIYTSDELLEITLMKNLLRSIPSIAVSEIEGYSNHYAYRDLGKEFDFYYDAKDHRREYGWAPFPSDCIQKHVQIDVYNENFGVKFTADEPIAHILQRLLDMGIYTEHSCQAHCMTTHPFHGYFSYININTEYKSRRPNTEKLREVKIEELADILGLNVLDGSNIVRKWRCSANRKSLFFNRDDVVLD